MRSPSEERHERALASHRRWYAEMRKDPVRYAHYLAYHRVWQAKYDAKRRENLKKYREIVGRIARRFEDEQNAEKPMD